MRLYVRTHIYIYIYMRLIHYEYHRGVGLTSVSGISPGWSSGNGLALQKYIDAGKLPLLQQMYKARAV